MFTYLMRPEQRRLRLYLSIAVLLILTVIWLTVIRTPAYAVYINGHKVFYTQKYQNFENAYQQIQDEQFSKYNKFLELKDTINVKRVFVPDTFLLPGELTAEVLDEALNFDLQAVALVVDGETIAYLKDEDTAKQLLKEIETQFAKVEEGETLISVSFNEDVQIVNEEISAQQLFSKEDAYALITMGTTTPEEYTVTEGDSLWLIARRNDLYVNDIKQANNLTGDDLSLGQKLVLTKTKPYINVAALVEGDRNEEIPFDVQVITDSSSSNVRVSQEGEPGEKRVVYQARKVNGQEESRTVVEETILKNAVDKIMVKGTQLQIASRGYAPAGQSAVKGSGNLNWPLYGTITQYFSRGHSGLDVAVPTGTAIKAADAGVVTKASWEGNYGYMVSIDHGNGIVTRYAHCSSLKVRVGQNVSRGEVIAASGSTGRSTGPHLHFEVLSGGVFLNPLSALN
ncbi:MAG: peptidoglycan DD-metalloendopeptidase family protein [Syntrophomonadaceae bacterium]|jgi:murein DD-endopeptidase MepM/ murein hydrolase activator NlpD|nr:peptidoglycan DD-metalloendopeptidase family protein [Syntrophomonadaceae bacterium]